MQPSLIKRFYEVLVLLRVVSQVQGSKISPQAWEAGPLEGVAEIEMRRRVMHFLCEMCDCIKGGDAVTAMAAENLPSGPRYWIASNSLLRKIQDFLSKIFTMLESRASSIPNEAETLRFEDDIFQEVVKFQRPRIKHYQKHLRTMVQRESRRIDIGLEEISYGQWLHDIAGRRAEEPDLARATKAAYDVRRSNFLRVDFDPIIMQPVTMESTWRRDIRHCVGRLCAPVRAAKVLTFASSSHPYLFQGFTLLPLQSGTPFGRPNAYPGLTLEGISNRMFSNDLEQLTRFREAFQLRDQKHSVIAQILEYYRGDKG
nr:hypothetical protein CFP56_33609 [Quercus suber]